MPAPQNYTKLLKQLKANDIQHVTVTPDEFDDFWPAFIKFSDRKRLFGVAKLNGQLVYSYRHD